MDPKFERGETVLINRTKEIIIDIFYSSPQYEYQVQGNTKFIKEDCIEKVE
jgi:putative salt-induced outer membrane protein YdiY